MENTVNVCPVCGKRGNQAVCQDCGFCFSSDYERYPTLVMIPGSVMSVRSLRSEYESRFLTAHCQCCGQIFSGRNCPYCGFVAIHDSTPANQEYIRELADKHRQQVLEQITDISVQYYQYRWNSQREKFDNLPSKEERIASGQQCYDNIVWSGMRFAQLPMGNQCTLGIGISYKGVKIRKHCSIAVPQCDSFWRIGVKIDEFLRLQVFLGDEKQATAAAPVMLQLN